MNSGFMLFVVILTLLVFPLGEIYYQKTLDYEKSCLFIGVYLLICIILLIIGVNMK